MLSRLDERFDPVVSWRTWSAPSFSISSSALSGINWAVAHGERETTTRRGNLRDHSFDVKVGEDNLDPFADLSVEEVVALGVARVKPGEVGTPERAVRRRGTIESEGARHRRNLLAGRDSEICMETNERRKEERRWKMIEYRNLYGGHALETKA